MNLRPLAALVLSLAAAARAVPAEPAAGPPALPAPEQPAQALERFVDWLQGFFLPAGQDSEVFHLIACGVLLLAAILLRHVITNFIFHWLKKLAARTETTLDDKLFPALEQPAATFVMVVGIFAALTVLKLTPQLDRLLGYGFDVALVTVVFWGVLRSGGAVLDHLQELAHERQLAVATFMPLIKKTLAVLIVVFGVLKLAEMFGANVQAFLAGLGIGGLAFAFAAQDTIANVFGSFVVVIDQPFRVGDFVKIGAHEGTVEDIGLRSTKIRAGNRQIIVIPNRTVANEAVTNISRQPQRRVDQTLGLTYDTTADQLEALLADLRNLLREDPGVHPDLIVANFINYGPSSLDIQVIYFIADPEFLNSQATRERINLKIMRAVAARGLSFAFPTQTVHVASLPANAKG
jgi:MscS family membrane protein